MTTTANRVAKTALSFLILAFAALAPLGAQAQDTSESHMDAARRAIAAIGATDAFDQVIPASAEGLKTRLIINNPNLDAEITEIVEDEALALVSRRADLENEVARAYTDAFTEDELNAIADFYETDAGSKLLETGPIVTREVNSSAQIWARGIERDLLEAVVQRMQEENLGANLPPEQGEVAPAGEQ